MTTLFFERAWLPGGWRSNVRVCIANDMIVRTIPDTTAESGDFRAGCAIPGMVNLHSHAFQRGMAGLSERRLGDDSFWSWREVMYRFLDRMTPDDIEAITALAYVEMLQGGFTRVGEFHYLHNDPAGHPYANAAEIAERIIAASRHTGISLTLLPCFYAHSDFGGIPATHGQRRFLTTLDRFATLLQTCESHPSLALAPHSLRAVTPDQLTHLVTLAAGRPIHIHAAEQTREVEACLAWSGQRPVEWLLDHAPVGPGWCLIHATHVTEAERAALARSGAVVGLCPITEASLGDGIFPAEAWRADDGRFGIGTDSNVLIGVAGELRQLEHAQRLATRRRNIMADAREPSTGAALFAASLAGGAAALAVPCPALAPGARADIVSLRSDAACFASDDPGTLLDGWIFAAGADAIGDVWCGGHHVVQGGRHVHADAIGARYRKTIRALAARC